MPAGTDVPRNVKLGNGESFTGLYDPSKDVKVTETDDFGTRYVVTFLGEDGKICKVRGGQRLWDAIDKATGNRGTPCKLRITAIGEPRALSRDYKAEVVK